MTVREEIFHINTGGIFIDHTTRTILNGSRLGKEYSANIFNGLYGEKQERINDQVQTTNLANTYKNSEQPISIDNGLGGVFSIFSPEPENHPKEEQPFPSRREKKKRKYGRQM